MAKRVIQMYDKYKSTTKTYPKIIKECLQKDVTDYIEGQVEANPTLAGTEASLTGLQVGDTKYKVEQPTTIVANPDPAGETELTGLQIGDTKYKVGGGKQLYMHNIYMSDNSTFMVLFRLINDVSEKLDTKAKINTALKNAGYTDTIAGTKCNVEYGRIVVSSTDYDIVWIVSNSAGTSIYATRIATTGSSFISNSSIIVPSSVNDTVQPL